MSGGSFDHNLSGITEGQGVSWDDTAHELVPADFAEYLHELLDVTGTASPVKGNLLVGDGTIWRVLPVGADGQRLTPESTDPLGLEWVDAASGGGGGDVAVEDDGVEVTPAASTLNFGANLSVTDNGSGKVTIDATGGGGDGSGCFSEVIGDGAATGFVITHALGTTDLHVTLWDLTSDPRVWATHDASLIEATTENSITVEFDSAPPASGYAVVVGCGGADGGSSTIYRHADPPDPADAFDEEFDTDPTAGWTWLNQSTAAVAVEDSMLVLSDNRNVNDVSFIGVAPPAGDWTIETLSYPWLAKNNELRSGGFLAVRYGSTINGLGFYQVNDLRTLTWASNGSGTSTAQSATPFTGTVHMGPAFLRASWDDAAGTLTWEASFTGAASSWFTVHSFSPGSTPDLVGFAGLFNRGHLIAYQFEYLRQTA